MEALGAAASVLQFASCAFKFFQTAKALYDGRNEFDLDQKALELSAFEFKKMAATLPPMESSPNAGQVDVAKMLADCHNIASKLLTQLDKFKGKKKSLFSSLQKAVTMMWTKEEVNEMLTRLDRHIQVLKLHIDSGNRDTLSTIHRTASSTEVMVSELVQWKNEFQLSQLDTEREMQEHHIRAKQRSIIKSLDLGLMDQRYMDISDASQSTYDWILSEDLSAQGSTVSSLVDSKSERSSKRPSCGLKSWLISGKGIFHILGKPGSGKSTLMKFICDDPRTSEALTTWAEPNELVVSHFFFWRHGQIYQRKINGLRRTLLTSVLSQMPEEIPFLFSDLWQRLDGGHMRGRSGFGVEENVRITDRQIRTAFDLMIKRAGSMHNAGYRFCFFIDGLDEFEEDADYGYWDLVDLLRRWVSESCGTIKMCVSSRELPVFQDQLSSASQNQIHLQDLTGPDIKSMVHNALIKDPYFIRLEKADPKECEIFVSNFVFRSEGVFLWVKLVLPNIRKALQNRSPFKKLCHMLNTIPSELEDFFKDIQASVRDEDQEEVYSIFGLLRLEIKLGKGSTFSLLSYSFLTELLESDDPDYAINHEIANPDQDDLSLRLEDASVRLRGYCCGLVELRPISTSRDIFAHLSSQFPLISQHLTFTHRTIPEFLQKMMDDPKRNNKPYLQEPNIIRLGIQKLMLRVKGIPFPMVPDLSSSSADATTVWKEMLDFMYGLTREIEVILLAVDQLIAQTLQQEFFGLLDALDEALCARQTWITKIAGPQGMNSLDLDWTRLHPVQPLSSAKKLKGRFPVFSLLHMAVVRGPTDYVWWRIGQRDEDGWLDYTPNRTEIFNTIANNTFPSSRFTVVGVPREAPGFVILEGLFDRGLSVYDYPIFRKNYHDDGEEVNYLISSLWLDVIWSVLCLEPIEKYEDAEESVAATTAGEGKKKPVEKDTHWDMFERFLRHGADPNVYFEELEPLEDDEWTDQGYIYSDNADFLKGDLGVVTFPTTGFIRFLAKQPDRTCCLRDFVDFMRPWNYESIVSIMDINEEHRGLEESWETC